jgi:hypothetical protein
MPKSTAVIKPNLGLYYDRPAIALSPGALQDGLNFRIKQGNLNNLNLGWSTYKSLQLNGPVTLINQFTTSAGVDYLMFGTPTDLYQYAGTTLSYLSPIYATGTVTASGTAVTGSGTAWATTPSGDTWANAKAGDQISFGSATQNLVSATWHTIASVNSGTSITLTSSAGTVAGGTAYTIRRRFTGAAFTNPWEFDYFIDANPAGADVIVLTNGIDNVVSWNGTDAQVVKHTEFGFTCANIVQFGDMMLYLNVLQGSTYLGTTMLNSDEGAPFAVGNASAGVAGQFIVQGQPDPILAAKRIGPYLAIYCQHNVIMCTLTGNATVFAFRIAVANKGPIGPNAIAQFPMEHQFIGPDSMYKFDGSNAEPVNTHIWRSILGTLDHLRAGNIFTFLDETNGEQIWSVPQTTDSGAGTITSPGAFAWVEHYLEETAGQAQSALIASAMGINRPYSKRTFAFTAIGNSLNASAVTWAQLTQAWSTYNIRWNDAFFSASFPIILVGDNSGFLWQLNASQQGAGTPLSSFVTFGRRALIDGRMRGLLRRIYPFVSQFSSNLTVTAGFADFASGPITTSPSFSFNQAMSTQGQFMVPVYRRGRYLDLGFGDATGNPWIINGYDMDILPGGMR